MSAAAQLAATVPSSDPVYSIIDELSATLPVRGLIVGQRPWSRREIARIVVAFQTAARTDGASSASAPLPTRVTALVQSLAAAYDADIQQLRGDARAPAIEGAPLRAVIVDALGTNDAARSIPPTGLGGIDAVANPLLEPMWGRPLAHGGTAEIETIHEIGFGAHLALAAQPRVTWLQPEGGGGHESVDFQRLYARATLLNIGIEGGLDELLWGQAGERGLLLSANPHPLHALTVANDTSITLPWILRYLGPTRAALMVADLGRDQHFPGAKLVNYKLSIAPMARLELGAALMDEMGGGGSPPCSLSCRVADLFPYVTWIHPGSDPLTTNKVAEAELRYRVPEAAGLTLTYEGDIDDFDLRRIRSMLWDNTGHVIGARLDRLTPDGRLALDVQVHHTGLTLYKHSQYLSGLTYRQAIVGDPLGVNGSAAYATLTWRQSDLTSVSLLPALESRDGSTYTVHTADRNGDGWTFVRVVDRPREQRARVVMSFDRQVVGTGLGFSVRAGIERVRNFDFVTGVERTNGFGEVAIRRYF